MSFEFYIVADRPIPEIKRNGQEILTVSDMIRMKVPDGPIPWKEMNENAKVLYDRDPSASNFFQIEIAPYASKIMSHYTDLKHVYKFDVSQLNLTKDLYAYVNSLDKEVNLEIWHLWFGYDNEDDTITKRNLLRSTFTPSDLEAELNESWCIAIKS